MPGSVSEFPGIGLPTEADAQVWRASPSSSWAGSSRREAPRRGSDSGPRGMRIRR